MPCIFTHDEIQTIFFTADKLRINHLSHRSPMFVILTICRLLYSTGIRVGEALAIKNKDIDFEKKSFISMVLKMINKDWLLLMKHYWLFYYSIKNLEIRLLLIIFCFLIIPSLLINWEDLVQRIISGYG